MFAVVVCKLSKDGMNNKYAYAQYLLSQQTKGETGSQLERVGWLVELQLI